MVASALEPISLEVFVTNICQVHHLAGVNTQPLFYKLSEPDEKGIVQISNSKYTRGAKSARQRQTAKAQQKHPQ